MTRYSGYSYEGENVGAHAPHVPDPVFVGLFDNEELGVVREFELPEGFYSADARTITPTELASIANSASPYPVQPDEYVEYWEERYKGEKRIGIGVRSEWDNELVGFGHLALLGHQGALQGYW